MQGKFDNRMAHSGGTLSANVATVVVFASLRCANRCKRDAPAIPYFMRFAAIFLPHADQRNSPGVLRVVSNYSDLLPTVWSATTLAGCVRRR
jgi:hypothetical protein